MHAPETVPPSAVRRAAAIARGPHACPSCEAPTWAEPPVPWTDLRDYVVRCDACERPIAVHVDPDLVLRRANAPREVLDTPGMYEPVEELLLTRGQDGFRRRLAAAMALPTLVALLSLVAGFSALTAVILFAALVLPGALFMPALLAAAFGELLYARRVIAERLGLRHARQGRPVELVAGRWDQLLREERRRERERADAPDAVLRELERVLDERELRRVRALAERGDVPMSHLDDLLRFRSAWTSTSSVA
jgi:hypothetical protein